MCIIHLRVMEKRDFFFFSGGEDLGYLSFSNVFIKDRTLYLVSVKTPNFIKRMKTEKAVYNTGTFLVKDELIQHCIVMEINV